MDYTTAPAPTSADSSENPKQTLRMQIAEQEKYLQKRAARLETAKAKLPPAWLDLTDTEIRDQFGIEIYL